MNICIQMENDDTSVDNSQGQDLDRWRWRFEDLVSCLSECQGISNGKVMNSFIEFTKIITEDCYPSVDVLQDLDCLGFFMDVIRESQDLEVLKRVLAVLDRIVTHSGYLLFERMESATTCVLACNRLLEITADYQIIYVTVKIMKTSCIFSTVFAQRLYHSQFRDLSWSWISRVEATNATDRDEFQVLCMIHHSIFQVYGQWLVLRKYIEDLNVEFLASCYVSAFRSPHEIIQEQICNTIKATLEQGDMWNLWIKSGVFEHVVTSVIRFHTPSAMDLISEGLISENNEYFASIIRFPDIAQWIRVFYDQYCLATDEERESTSALFSASLALLSNAFLSGHLDIDREFVGYFLSKSVTLLEEAPFESKETLTFTVLALVNGIGDDQIGEYIPILSLALDVASAGSSVDVLKQSLSTISTILDRSTKGSQTIPFNQEIIKYVRSLADHENQKISDEANEVLDNIEEALRITID